MMYVISIDPFIKVSPEAVQYMRTEHLWILAGHTEDFMDKLESTWNNLSSQDIEFMNSRGYLTDDYKIWEHGNGFQWSMMDILDAVPELE